MPGDAAVRVIRIAVVYLTVEDVLPPAVPRRRISEVPIAKGRIIDHVLLVDIPLFGGGELREAMCFRIECRRPQPEWAIEILLQKRIETLATHALDDITEQHETEVAVVPRVADAPLERHVANDAVGLSGVGCVIVQRLPLHESGRM